MPYSIVAQFAGEAELRFTRSRSWGAEKMDARTTLKAMCLVALCLLDSGCAITRVDRGNGQIETIYTLLAPINRVNLPAEGAYVETRGIGVSAAAGQMSIGAFDIKALSISPDCRLVVLAATDEQIEAWRKLLKDSGPLCSPSEPRGK